MNRCDDKTKSCINCNNAKIKRWDKKDNYYCTFECPYYQKDIGMIISFLEKHTCNYFDTIKDTSFVQKE